MKDLNKTAKAAANYVNKCLFHRHRGVIDCDDKFVIFGNDGYEDSRCQEQVDLMRQVLAENGLERSEFGVNDGGYSWAFVVFNYEQKPIDIRTLEQQLWECRQQACGLESVSS